MARALLAVALLVTAFLAPGGQASSLRSRRIHARNPGHADSFRKNFGWPGFKFPADRWGVVIDSLEAEKAAAADASSTIVPPNLGTAPVNIAPSPSSDSPTPIFSALSIVSSVPQAVPTPTGLSDISVANLTSSASQSSIPEPTSSSAAPLVKPSSSSAESSPSVSSPVFVQQRPTSSHAPQSSSVSSSPLVPSHSSSSPPSVPSQSIPPPASPSPSPVQSPVQSPSPVNVGTGSGSSSQGNNQGNQGGTSASSSSSDSDSGSGTSPADIQAYLTAHNTVRAQHGAAPLTYSQSLAAKAQQWANGCVFQHSGGTLGPFGENLAAGTGSGYGIPQAIGSWTAEVSQYNPNDPQASHFTQVVWKSTTEVGCAEQDCSGIFPSSFGLAHYYVCEYSPQGNVIGEFPANVQV